MIIKFSELEKTVYGRHDYTEDGALALSWSASGFELAFEARRLCLYFSEYRADQPCYVKLVLDGCEELRFAITSGAEVAVIDNIPEGEHTLRLYRLSAGDCLLKCEKLELFGHGESLPKVLPAPSAPELRLEFFGDSITCGYGDLADRGVSVYRTFEEDSTKTYAFLTAKALNADMRAVCISGQGIVKNCRGEEGYRIPHFFEHELRVGRKPHDFSSWTPNVVVINAGTNDGGGQVSFEDFGRESGIFLDRIREVYPNAEIFWVYGMMGLRYNDVLAEVIGNKDEHIHYVPVKPIYEMPGETGANGHPNEKGQARAAAILTEAIKNALCI